MILKRFTEDVTKYFRYSIVAARSQLKAEVADSYLNWIWWILDPFCFMLIYTFIFGYVFKSSELYFPVYIFIGLSMWDFFSKTVQSSVKMIKTNKHIVSKVYFPKFILLLTRVWVNGFKMLVSFGIVVLMMLFFRVPLTLNVLWFVPLILCLGIFTFGCSCFLMHYGVYVNDLANVVSIVTRMLFYLTGIFFNLEARIPQYGTMLMQYNPVAFMISSMRKALLYGQSPAGIFMLVWVVVGIVLSMAGVKKIYQEENNYVKSI